MQNPDDPLAHAAASGDRSAFAQLLARHYDRIFTLSWRLTGTKADAEDLTQDICAALPAKLKSFQGQAQFSTWLYRVTLNAAHDRRRRRATYMRATTGWGDWETARQAEMTQTAAATDWLTQAMTQLPPDLRDTVALTLGEDLTQAEAATILGLSEGTIAWRMAEVKKHLRRIAEQEAIQ